MSSPNERDEVQIISVEPSSRPLRRRRLRPLTEPVDVISVDSDEDDDIEIMEIRPLPPQEQHVLHAPGSRTFPLGASPPLPVRSFPNTRSRAAGNTRIRSPLEVQLSYQQRQIEERRRAREIRNRNTISNRLNQRILSLLPPDMNLGLGQLFIPGTINDLMFRNESSETDDDYHPRRDQDEERETQFWINRIQQIEARENDERIGKRLKFSETYKKQLLSKVNTKQQNLNNYFNSVKEDKLPVCLQCGVELGEGIPMNHTKSSKPLLDLIKQTKMPAPYEFFDNYNETDLLNSKKIFYSKNCGHLYCGRCIQFFQKLNNRNNKLKKIKIELNDKLSFDIFANGEPILNLKRCCGYQCNCNLHKFYEVYF